MLKIFHVFFYFFAFQCVAWSMTQDVQVKHLSTQQGLSENTVRTIYQDSYGFIWVGTRSGLNKYDGYTFKKYYYSPDDSLSISGDFINAIVEDANGILWIGTDLSGLNAYDRNCDTFQHFKASADTSDETCLPENTVYCLHIDQHGKLWVGTELGLASYDPVTRQFITYFRDEMIRTLFEDENETFWIGTNHGLLCWDRKSNATVEYRHQADQVFSLGSDMVQAVVADSSGRIWVGTIDGGLNLFNRKTQEFCQYPYKGASKSGNTSNSVYTLHVDSKGGLWAGYENAGLQQVIVVESKRMLPPQVRFKSVFKKSSIAQPGDKNSVLDIFEDMQGNFWIGTYWEGLQYICRNRKQFENYYADSSNPNWLNHNHVHCFLEDDANNIWLGTDGGGLNYFDRQKEAFSHFTSNPNQNYSISSDHVLDMCFDKKDNLWLATWDGLNYLDVRQQKFIHYVHEPSDHSSLSSNKVMCVLLDREENLWVGTIAGLNVSAKDGSGFSHTFDGDGTSLSTAYVHSLSEDRHGNIWVVTAWGIFFLPQEQISGGRFQFRQYAHVEGDSLSLSENRAYTVYEDHTGEIWITTINGLNRFNPASQQFKVLTSADGLASNWIASVIEDNRNQLWLGTHCGISKLDLTTRQFINYDTYDGLGSSEYGSGVLKCRSGELVFGGKNGFTLFHPDSIKTNTFVAPVVLTDFQIFNHSVPLAQIAQNHAGMLRPDSIAIQLEYQQKVISFEFASLDYSSPEKNRYQYMLEGFDAGWRTTDASRRFVTYTNLREGNYIFKVKGTNGDGVWNEKGCIVAINIHPPFWRTPWALLIYFLSVVLVLVASRELIVYREKLKNEIEFERKEAERVHAVDVMKLRFFTNVSHEFRTPLTLIIGLLEKIFRNIQTLNKKELLKNIQMIHNNARKLLHLINQIMDIRKLDEGGMTLQFVYRDVIPFLKAVYSAYTSMAEQRNIQYQFVTQGASKFMAFDPDKIEKMLNNLLSNAFKFTADGGSVKVAVSFAGSPVSGEVVSVQESEVDTWLEIAVQDTGIGIDQENIKHIFDPFFQVEHDQSMPTTGTGIGLALTHELVELHHGFIRVNSQLKQGTTFVISLPVLKKIEVDQGYDVMAHQPYMPVSVIPSDSDHTKNSHDETLPNLLIVDDDTDFCTFLKGELEREFDVALAKDGEEALNSVESSPPDLIITDIRMPKMSGYELCNKIKADEKTAHIPIIMLTSQTNMQSRLQGFNCGADAYVEKPFDMQLLRNRIVNLMASRKRLKDKFSQQIYLQPLDISISSENGRFLTQVIEIIDKEIESVDFGVKELGDAIGLSRVQLYRKIKALTELTPSELLRTIRLKRAAQLLKESQLTISEIAYRTGFAEVSYFCKCFKDHYGLSPAGFAKSDHEV